MQGKTFLSFSSVSFRISFEHAVQLPVTVLLYSTFPDNYAFLSLLPSQIKNTQSADTVPVHGHSPLVWIFLTMNWCKPVKNKHSDACIYLPPYKLDVLKIVEYKFSCEMESHVEVTTSLMFDCNTFKDKRHLLTLVAVTLPSKELQFCNFIMQ